MNSADGFLCSSISRKVLYILFQKCITTCIVLCNKIAKQEFSLASHDGIDSFFPLDCKDEELAVRQGFQLSVNEKEITLLTR